MKNTISIIIPIYNVEKYLERCLDSVIAGINDSSLCEMLLIDDGSTDNSGSIAERYSKKYEWIKTYHKKNGGLSDARNYGLHRATKNYVIFIDSDDMVDPREFAYLIDSLENAVLDVVLFDARLIDENDIIISTDSEYYQHSGLKTLTTSSGVNCINTQLNDYGDFVTTVWLGAYKRNFLIEENHWFEKGLIHEDELWTIKVLVSAREIQYLKLFPYLYRQRQSGSIMTDKGKNKTKNIKDLVYIYSTLYAYIDWKCEENTRKLIKANISKRFLHALANYEFYRYKNIIDLNDISLIKKNAVGLKDNIRACLLLWPRGYCIINKIACNR